MLREQEILVRSIEVIVKYLNPQRILLFGSRVKAEFNPHADFDLAIDCKMPDRQTHREILDEIENFAGLYEVDIIYMDQIDAQFRNIILTSGRVLYEK